jgi:hypothetical protein
MADQQQVVVQGVEGDNVPPDDQLTLFEVTDQRPERFIHPPSRR